MRIEVSVKSGKNESKVIKNDFGKYEVWVRSRPTKGAANREVITVLASYFNTKKNCLRIVKGLTSPIKLIELSK